MPSFGARRRDSDCRCGLSDAQATGQIDFGFESWRPTLYAYVLLGDCLCAGQVLVRGEQGKRALFVLPAALFVISMVVFPLLFGLVIAFSDWNLSSPDGRQFNGSTMSGRCGTTRSTGTRSPTWWYTLAIIGRIRHRLSAGAAAQRQIKARKFFRVAFLLPLMLSPVA
jgi:multiple sugar transport system permease protein